MKHNVQIWERVDQCAKTNMVPDCKPPAIAAKPRTTVGKVNNTPC